jgi:hypothetical protein
LFGGGDDRLGHAAAVQIGPEITIRRSASHRRRRSAFENQDAKVDAESVRYGALQQELFVKAPQKIHRALERRSAFAEHDPGTLAAARQFDDDRRAAEPIERLERAASSVRNEARRHRHARNGEFLHHPYFVSRPLQAGGVINAGHASAFERPHDYERIKGRGAAHARDDEMRNDAGGNRRRQAIAAELHPTVLGVNQVDKMAAGATCLQQQRDTR